MLRIQHQHLQRLMSLQLQLFRVYESYLTVTLVQMNPENWTNAEGGDVTIDWMVDKQH